MIYFYEKASNNETLYLDDGDGGSFDKFDGEWKYCAGSDLSFGLKNLEEIISVLKWLNELGLDGTLGNINIVTKK